MPSMPDIKLTRTDTTHDLSQKAEKRCVEELSIDPFLSPQNGIHCSWLMWLRCLLPLLFSNATNNIRIQAT